MNQNAPILFGKSLEQVRHIGARGGRATARNRKARLRILSSMPQTSVSPSVPTVETAAEAIATLDAQFPWLRGAERRHR
jgi:hypothetical protein